MEGECVPPRVSGECVHVPPRVSAECVHVLPRVSAECVHVPPRVSAECVPPRVSGECVHVPPRVSAECVPPRVSGECVHVPPRVSGECVHVPPRVSAECVPPRVSGECVRVLPRVCELLAATGSSLADDTSLEKLLDWISSTARNGVSLLEVWPCLKDFLPKVALNPASDASILSFTVKLAGLIGASEDGFKALEEGSLWKLLFDAQHWQEAGRWEDPCLRIGWIHGLQSILQHSEALGFFVQADLIEPLLQLQTDSSLFVTSAANQTLTHLLSLCQSLSSVGCDGEHSGSLMEIAQMCSDVVTRVSEYLNQSVGLKEPSQLPECRQILRLLTLLLVQVRPPLRDSLLLAVIEPLEELVARSCSQLTLPLMDVLLAANGSLSDDRVPKQRISRLLSSMLNIKKPADALQAAATLLRSQHTEPILAAHSARVLLLPLEIVSGVTFLEKNCTADGLRILMTEQLKSKSCISMICLCLTSISQMVPVAPERLPCPPRLIVRPVLSLLTLCCVDCSCPSGCCVEVVRFVTGSTRVQKCALESLSALSKNAGVKELVEVFKVLTEYLNSPCLDTSVLQKSYQALINWTDVCTDLSCIPDQLREDLIQAVRKRACDLRWEARDSTLEFLGHLAGWRSSSEEARGLSNGLLGGCSFALPLLKEALQDPESYVRSSSISALAQTLTPSWQQGASLTQEQMEIVTRLLEILSQDSEGFARRAVVKYFITWLSSCSSPASCPPLVESVPSVLCWGVADLDWEVKLHTLELAELLLDQAFPHRAASHPYAVASHQSLRPHAQEKEADSLCSLNSLVDRGVVSALFCGLVDCDRPVALKACQLLVKLRDAVRPLMVSKTEPRVFCKLPGPSLMQDIRLMGMKDAHMHVAPAATSEVAEERGDPVCVSVCEVLRCLDLDERLSILTRSSDHVYNSPLSLLQDILTASSSKSHPSSEPGQEVIVDCY